MIISIEELSHKSLETFKLFDDHVLEGDHHFMGCHCPGRHLEAWRNRVCTPPGSGMDLREVVQ